MRMIQIGLDEDLARRVDQTVRKLRTTRSAFTRGALRAALDRPNQKELERKHREGYLRKPVAKGEFSVWQSEQVWVGNHSVSGGTE